MSEAIMQRLASFERGVLAELRDMRRAMEQSAAARVADDDGWTRLPRPLGRCPVSGWSRSTILNKIRAGGVRTKIVGGARYYATKDVSNLINQ
jgi:hypothetical protein